VDAVEHGEVVLAGILPVRVDLLERALGRLEPEHFADPNQRVLFRFLQAVYENYRVVMPEKFLADACRKQNLDVGKRMALVSTYELLRDRVVDDVEFDWSTDQLRDLLAEKDTGQAITDAMEILKKGKTDKDGEVLRGHADARTYLLTAMDRVDERSSSEIAPAGDLQDDLVDFERQYRETKERYAVEGIPGIRFGLPPMDVRTGGMHPGDLILIIGYVHDGKTHLCVQTAWSAAIQQGKNVVFFTTETIREQVNRRIIARHSRELRFGLPLGINSKDLKMGTVPEQDEPALAAVVQDLRTNPAYGKIHVVQVPRYSTVASIEQRMYRILARMDIDLVILDYLNLLKSDRNRAAYHEDASAIIKEAKQVATTFNGGQGVPFISPWQVTRTARERSENTAMYTLQSLSDTSEASKSPDTIVSIWAPETTDRTATVTLQVLKCRDGERANDLRVQNDRATSFFAPEGVLLNTRLHQPTASVISTANGIDNFL
jgi:replicative DNA helicase